LQRGMWKVHKTIIGDLMEELDLFYDQLDNLAPSTDSLKTEERKKFSTFYVVCVAATYENCIRDILYDYSDFYHKKFSFQVEKKYQRLNSKIKYIDLRSIISSFDGNAKWFDEKCTKIGSNFSIDLMKAYDQILDWRHSAAHANKFPASLEEIYKTHGFVKHVIYSFEESLLGHVRHQIISEASTKVYVAKKISKKILEMCSIHNEKHQVIKSETELMVNEMNKFKHIRRRAISCPEKSQLLLGMSSEMLETAQLKIRELKATG
jgi:hypothetical protein